MLEHIFRNINDIRVFDFMVDFILNEEGEKREFDENNRDDMGLVVDIDEILKFLECGEYKRLEIEDSVEHLVRQKVLGIKKVKSESKTGCKICKYAEKMKIPRVGEHKKHLPEEVIMGCLHYYYMKTNEITNSLRSAIYANVLLTIEEEIDNIDNK